ncbi:hypothetical protein Pelo_9291 [Pelomyxa schiedti]|nr:hypothetical protein Pelo_9291 [Pelomyxa schiedti]
MLDAFETDLIEAIPDISLSYLGGVYSVFLPPSDSTSNANASLLFESRADLIDKNVATFMRALQDRFSIASDVTLVFPGLGLSFRTGLSYAEQIPMSILVHFWEALNAGNTELPPLVIELKAGASNFTVTFNKLLDTWKQVQLARTVTATLTTAEPTANIETPLGTCEEVLEGGSVKDERSIVTAVVVEEVDGSTPIAAGEFAEIDEFVSEIGALVPSSTRTGEVDELIEGFCVPGCSSPALSVPPPPPSTPVVPELDESIKLPNCAFREEFVIEKDQNTPQPSSPNTPPLSPHALHTNTQGYTARKRPPKDLGQVIDDHQGLTVRSNKKSRVHQHITTPTTPCECDTQPTSTEIHNTAATATQNANTECHDDLSALLTQIIESTTGTPSTEANPTTVTHSSVSGTNASPSPSPLPTCEPLKV